MRSSTVRNHTRATLFTMTIAGTATLLLSLSAIASPTHHAKQSSQPGNHTLGSQIRKHEASGSEPAVRTPRATVPGVDVASYQAGYDWQASYAEGNRFAYVKATENTNYTNPEFGGQYSGSYDVGMIRGAYHFAVPNASSGAAQANFFIDNGGAWTADGKTLPGALDMEYNPYGDTCYGMDPAALSGWIKEFNDTYRARTGRDIVIYTSTNWWNQCVQSDFSASNPLWIARYADSPGPLPPNWQAHTFWQYTSEPLDQNLFNGTMDRLQSLANG